MGIKSDNTISYTITADRKWEGTKGTDLSVIIDNYVAVGKVMNLSS